jgi:hypothetical protein
MISLNVIPIVPSSSNLGGHSVDVAREQEGRAGEARHGVAGSRSNLAGHGARAAGGGRKRRKSTSADSGSMTPG